MTRPATVLVLMMLAVWTVPLAEVREPRYPLKTDRTLFSDAAIAQVRENVANYDSARKLAEAIIERANTWVERPYDQLLLLMPSADVPRAFNVGTEGCPKCGKAIYEKGGTYPWTINLERPFTVQCPICSGVYPDNDFAAYYKSGFSDKNHLGGEFADDGRGWTGPPNGHRYWFVAYAVHWTWHSHVIPGLSSLGQAYLLTGDKRYAHQAAVMLHRLAEVYPNTDYHNQSRYGFLTQASGGHYGGKLVNLIWATGNLQAMAETYDAVWDAIDDDAALQSLVGKSGEEIRAFIEANVLEEGIDAVFEGEVRGNYGMHQRALVYAALARQHGETDAWIGSIFEATGVSPLHTGLNYALYNLVYRDGVPYETAPGYNSIWVTAITEIADTLRGTRWDPYALPKTQSLYDGVLDVINAGKFTPALGDSGSVYGGRVLNPALYQSAYRAYQKPRYLEVCTANGAIDENSFTSFRSLLEPPLSVTEPPLTSTPQPRLLAGYGMGILNNAEDSISMALYYGFTGGHGHFDRLGFELFANGRPMMPDLGYPDFMNGYVSGIYTWSKNTISHNTVTVDASRQPGNEAGRVKAFAAGNFARVIDVDASQTYPQCSVYRRCMVMIDKDSEHSYYVDFFTVTGGNQHDYSLHGPPGNFQAIGGEWESQATGTLAGPDVEAGATYDDPVRGASGFDGTWYAYSGSGFQHLVNVRRHTAGPWFAQYEHAKDQVARLRIRMLPGADTAMMLADAQVSPVKQKELVTYLLARRQGENLGSRFVSVLEPYRGEPFIAHAYPTNEALAGVEVTFADGTRDLIVYNPTTEPGQFQSAGFVSDALISVLRLDTNGNLQRLFSVGGAGVTFNGVYYPAPEALSGTVAEVDAMGRRVRLVTTSASGALPADDVAGQVAFFDNGRRSTVHPIAAAQRDGDTIWLETKDHLLVGRARVTAIAPDTLTTNTSFMFAPVYAGAYVTDADFGAVLGLASVEEGALHLAEPLPEAHPFAVDEDVWLLNVGPGDSVSFHPILNWEAQTTNAEVN